MFPRMRLVSVVLATLVVAAPVRGAPAFFTPRAASASVQMQNGLDAQKANANFTMIGVNDSCEDGAQACINSDFAQCVSGSWVLEPCAAGLQCFVVPLVNSAGTSMVCDSQADALARLASAGVSGGLFGNNAVSNTNATTASDSSDSDDNDDDCESDDSSGDDEGDDGDSTTTDTSSATSATDGAQATSTSAPAAPTVTVTMTLTLPGLSASPTTTPTSSASAPTSSNANVAGYKRQLQSHSSITSTAPGSTTAFTVVTNTVTQTVSAVSSSSVTGTSPTSTSAGLPTVVTAETGVSSTSSFTSVFSDPTGIVIGSDGFRTVTVVSTVTVGCGASTAVPTLTSSSSSATTSIVNDTPTLSGPSSPIITSQSATSVSSTSASSSSIPAQGPATPAIKVNGFSSTTASTSSANAASQISGPTTTPAPTDYGVNSDSETTPVDISEQITAAVPTQSVTVLKPLQPKLSPQGMRTTSNTDEKQIDINNTPFRKPHTPPSPNRSTMSSKRKWDQPAVGEDEKDTPTKVARTEESKTASDAAAAAAAIAAKIAAQFANGAGALKDLHDGEYTHDIDINDVRNRYLLTKGSTQEQINEETGASVSTKGVWYPDRSKATDENPPLFIHISAHSSEARDAAIKKINELIAIDMGSLVESKTDRQKERRKWPEQKLPVGLETIRNFNVRAKVVGPSGSFVKYIQAETSTRVQIKGIGSGFVDQETGQEEPVPLYIHITGPEEGQVARAKVLTDDLLLVVRQEHAKAAALVQQQQMELHQAQAQYAAYAMASYPGQPGPSGGEAAPPAGTPAADAAAQYAASSGPPAPSDTEAYAAYWAAYGYDVNSAQFKEWQASQQQQYAQYYAQQGYDPTASAAPAPPPSDAAPPPPPPPS
ncbi:hypothetical protein H0H93_006448 [Arthromyces matolae]|nr:hypothetical protein H0H93_006448 [Arthromyces matolae]